MLQDRTTRSSDKLHQKRLHLLGLMGQYPMDITRVVVYRSPSTKQVIRRVWVMQETGQSTPPPKSVQWWSHTSLPQDTSGSLPMFKMVTSSSLRQTTPVVKSRTVGDYQLVQISLKDSIYEIYTT